MKERTRLRNRGQTQSNRVLKRQTKTRLALVERQIAELDAEIAKCITLREPCPCCGGPMRIIESCRRGQKPMSRAPLREQAA
ncbi:MAG: hypothetical protein R6V26_07130 [Roseovarius sp.]